MKKKLIIFNRNAYILRDLYCHALKEYSKFYDVYFITSDLFTSKEIIKTFKNYVFKRDLCDFIIIKNNISSVLFSKHLNNFMRNLKNSNYQVLTSIPFHIIDFIFLKKIQNNKSLIITWFDNFKIDINHFNTTKIKIQDGESIISNFLKFIYHFFLNKNYYSYQNLILTKLLFPHKKIYFVCFNDVTKKLYNNYCPFLKIYTIQTILKNKIKYQKKLLILGTIIKKRKETHINKIINFLYRDISYLKKRYKISKILFRPHPREKKDQNSLKLEEILKKKFKEKIKITISKSNYNLQNLFKTCSIIVGFPSTSLTLAKRYSDTLKVFGLLDSSKILFKSPEIMCGDYKNFNSGIDWIDKNGVLKKKTKKTNFDFINLKDFLKNVR